MARRMLLLAAAAASVAGHPEASAKRRAVERDPDPLALFLLGGGVRLFDPPRDGIRLEKLLVCDGPFATHRRYQVIRQAQPT
jgi:hypothetical protein